MIWCAVKSDEVDRARRLAAKAGRAADFIAFSPRSGHTVDLARYGLSRPGGSIDSLIRSFDRLTKALWLRAIRSPGAVDTPSKTLNATWSSKPARTGLKNSSDTIGA